MAAPSEVILEPRKIKSDTVSTVSPSISHEVLGPDAHPEYNILNTQRLTQAFRQWCVIGEK